jgi:hypothetical protein
MGCPLKAGGPPHFGDEVNFTDTFRAQSRSHPSSQSHTRGLPDRSLDGKLKHVIKGRKMHSIFQSMFTYLKHVLCTLPYFASLDVYLLQVQIQKNLVNSILYN